MEILSGKDSRDGRRSNRAVLTAAEDGVDETGHKTRVESVLGRQTSDIRVRYGLGDDGETDGETSHQVRDGEADVVTR